MNHYKGRKIVLADMNDGFITTADLNPNDPNHEHPSDEGYKKMAAVWWAAFQIADGNGWLTATRATNRNRPYAIARLAQLKAEWDNLLAGNPTPEQRSLAALALADIQNLNDQINDAVNFNTDPFRPLS
jgi:hypothetical protein